jgi:ATP-binding protein involved in chromosome partitioning
VSDLTQENILAVLRTVSDPQTARDVVSAGLISGVAVKGGKVGFLIAADVRDKLRAMQLQAACEAAVKNIAGVESVTAVLTAESEGQSAEKAPARKAVWNTTPLAHVGRVIAVASGKGGVGKSTTAVNLAYALAKLGRHVGVLDADIYGPSVPRMMGLTGKPAVNEQHQLVPLLSHGVRAMSMGLMVDEGSAIVWRGPQMSKALHQMLRGVVWGTEQSPLDVLLIDMPPGTGDIHLSLVQQAPVSGVVIVTTPQDVAVADARKCIDMFRKVNVPILGIIENMSGFTDASGKHYALFGEGGGKQLAQAENTELLGSIAIDMQLRIASDSGDRFEDATEIYAKIAMQL